MDVGDELRERRGAIAAGAQGALAEWDRPAAACVAAAALTLLGGGLLASLGAPVPAGRPWLHVFTWYLVGAFFVGAVAIHGSRAPVTPGLIALIVVNLGILALFVMLLSSPFLLVGASLYPPFGAIGCFLPVVALGRAAARKARSPALGVAAAALAVAGPLLFRSLASHLSAQSLVAPSRFGC